MVRSQSCYGWKQTNTKFKAALFGRTAWTENREKKTRDIKDEAGKSGRNQIAKGFGRNVKEFEFYSKNHRKPLK